MPQRGQAAVPEPKFETDDSVKQSSHLTRIAAPARVVSPQKEVHGSLGEARALCKHQCRGCLSPANRRVKTIVSGLPIVRAGGLERHRRVAMPGAGATVC